MRHAAIPFIAAFAVFSIPALAQPRRPFPAEAGGTSAPSVAPSSLAFGGILNGSAPAPKMLSIAAGRRVTYTVAVSIASGGPQWLAISPSGALRGNTAIAVSVALTGLAAGTYNGAITVTADGNTTKVPVSFAVGSAGTAGGAVNTAGYKLIGWNDLGMHCLDGKDYSIFAVLPPYNTIHAHLLDPTGKLIVSPGAYTVTYQAVTDPITTTLNTTSAPKTNLWQYAAALGFGALAPDVGQKGFAMPGASNAPQVMKFSTSDNTWLAEGIPLVPYADAAAPPYRWNPFPMMRLIAQDSSGAVLAATDIVLPTSDEMDCAVCHASNAGYSATMPANGWIGHTDPAKDVKLNILRKHDDRFAASPLFRSASAAAGYSASGLEATTASRPILCAACHASNALSAPGYAGVPALTAAMHGLHSGVADPATGQTLDSGASRDTCYRCHPGPNTQCLRGAMGTLKNTAGRNAIECQSCHGPMSAVAAATRNGWLDEPNCQACHTGTATNNSGQIVYTSVFAGGTAMRTAADNTFATNPNTPAAGVSLYRFSSGHGGLQCEACHGSTHAEFATPVVNDNVQSTALQGHAGALAECSACHNSIPNTITGGPHGLHPIGSSWVRSHQSAAESNRAACQTCHGTDYRGTLLSRAQADRSLNGRTFATGTIIGCYSCHNGPNP